MKKYVCILLSAMLCLLLSACAANEAMRYEDNFDELDISGRINEIAYEIDRGKTSAYLYAQLDVVIEDLEYITPEGENLHFINDSFILVAETLKKAMDCYAQEDYNAFQAHYDTAKTLYNSANNQLNRYKQIGSINP